MNVLKPHLQTTIWTLLDAGASQREIERVTGIDRKTIRAYQKRFAAAAANSPGVATGSGGAISPTPATGCDGRCGRRGVGVRAASRLHRGAVAAAAQRHGHLPGPGGSIRLHRRLRLGQALRAQAAPTRARTIRSPGVPARRGDAGRLRRGCAHARARHRSLSQAAAVRGDAALLAAVSFRRVVWSSSQETWARLHEQAWRYFGGSCRYVVLDNLKEGVLKPDLYEPELNPVYAATLAHYGVVADPARVRDPNRKGSVENAIGHTQATALKGRRFESLEEQNDFLEHWERKWAAPRIHGSARRQVQAMFEEERPLLQPLPTLGMQFFTESQRTVCDDSCVRVDHSSYAARPAPIGSRVLVRVFEHRIEIRDLKTQALLRTHARVERPGSVVLPMEERVFNPSRETRRILAQAKAIGADAERLCQMLFAIEGRVGQRKLWGIVGLAERYPRRLVDRACAQSIADGIHSYRHVKALTEKLVADALAAIDAADGPRQGELALTQEHPLIRPADIYAELFTRCAAQPTDPSTPGGAKHDHQ